MIWLWLLNHWRFAAAAVALGALFVAGMGYRQSLINEGYDRALRHVEKQNVTAVEAARRARRTVDQCYDEGGIWSVLTGECALASNSATDDRKKAP